MEGFCSFNIQQQNALDYLETSVGNRKQISNILFNSVHLSDMNSNTVCDQRGVSELGLIIVKVTESVIDTRVLTSCYSPNLVTRYTCTIWRNDEAKKQ